MQELIGMMGVRFNTKITRRFFYRHILHTHNYSKSSDWSALCKLNLAEPSTQLCGRFIILIVEYTSFRFREELPLVID